VKRIGVMLTKAPQWQQLSHCDLVLGCANVYHVCNRRTALALAGKRLRSLSDRQYGPSCSLVVAVGTPC